MLRNPQLSVHQAQSLLVARAKSACNKETISNFFGTLSFLYAKLNTITNPMLIHNVDETGESQRKLCIQLLLLRSHTIMTCGSASGKVLLIFP